MTSVKALGTLNHFTFQCNTVMNRDIHTNTLIHIMNNNNYLHYLTLSSLYIQVVSQIIHSHDLNSRQRHSAIPGYTLLYTGMPVMPSSTSLTLGSYGDLTAGTLRDGGHFPTHNADHTSTYGTC